MNQCKATKNKQNCTCTYEPCPRKGLCCECVSYHRKNGELPGCFFTKKEEATFDRSIANFVRARQNVA